MYTYPLYAMVARPKSTLLGNCQLSPGYVSDEEAEALGEMASLRQEIREMKRMVARLEGILCSQGALHQGLTQMARLRERHHSWHHRFLLANRHKHEQLGHINPSS